MSRPLAAILLSSAVAAGCAGAPADTDCARGAGDPCDGRTGPDAGAFTGDGAPGGGADDGGAEAPPTGIPAAPDGSRGLGPASCYDDAYNEASNDVQCDDPGCRPLGSCCVGSGDCCAPMASPPLPSGLVLEAGCTGPAAGCLGTALVTPFGDPVPYVSGGLLHPGGDSAHDSGLVIGGPVDLASARVTVETTFHAPTDCSSSCLEGVGVAFTTLDTFGDETNVRALVGLLASGAWRSVMLVVADTPVASWPLGDGSERYRLVLRPTGEVEAYRDGVLLEGGQALFPTALDARLVVYGRNRSQVDPTGAGIGDLTATVELCDMPQAWRSRDELIVQQPPTMAPLDSGVMRGPSVAAGDGPLALIFEDQGVFRFARRGSEDHRFTIHNAIAFDPPGETWNEVGIDDPELVWNGSEWVLFYTATGTMGQRTIGRARATDPSRERFTAEPDPLLLPDGEVEAYSMPAVLPHPYRTGTWILIARADLRDGTHQLRTFVSTDDGERFAPWEFDGLPALTTRGGAASRTGFDADEIAAPSLVVQNGAYHLYYAGRRGTRWRIGMLASDDLVHWRAVNGGAAVLEGDGSGRDRVGVTDPDVYVNGTTVELVYVGQDGAQDTLFRAARNAPEEATR